MKLTLTKGEVIKHVVGSLRRKGLIRDGKFDIDFKAYSDDEYFVITEQDIEVPERKEQPEDGDGPEPGELVEE